MAPRCVLQSDVAEDCRDWLLSNIKTPRPGQQDQQIIPEVQYSSNTIQFFAGVT